MSVCIRHKFILSAGLMLAVAAQSPAFAYEAEDVASRLASSLAKMGYDISWSSSSLSGDDIVLENVMATMAGVEEKAALGAVELNGVAETDNGAYTIEMVSLPDYVIEEDKFKISINGGSMSGLYLPPEGAEKTVRALLPYSAAGLAGINMTGPDGEFFNMTNIQAVINLSEEAGPLDFTTIIEKFTFNSTSLPESEGRATLSALGYSVVEGSVDSSGVWDPVDGRMVLEKLAIQVNDAGTLDMTMDIGGYTMEFMESFQTLQKKMVEEGENGNGSAGIAMLGLMQQIIFNSASIRFDDNSLTNRVLEFVAAQQGVTPSDIVNQAKAVLPFALAQLNNPEFSAEVTSAVSAYLDNPQNLEISAKPGTPLPIAMIMASGMSAPNQLPNQLGVKVMANQ